ncbi:hypothetical protein Nepgr_016155 [Nepenthes gracilis]|uniref:WRKY domain-containing protein n=1 Tax=Nepenthes gracilis TaxID=150966 RepID=A0AAD3SP90_NEPGR|nr:hypothetical protein Nepgr_016155 [Nepenthes gracilis]
MDHSACLWASLDLKLYPLRLFDDTPGRQGHEKETQSITFDELGCQHSPKDETGALVAELNQVSAENRRLTERLTAVCEKYNALRRQLEDCTSFNAHPPPSSAPSIDEINKKRKAAGSNGRNNHLLAIAGNSHSCSSDPEDLKNRLPKEEIAKAKISRVYVRAEASENSLMVNDGYQWRKYGQKVTRDNPSPRAYFKCSFAPGCPVKKKVQRSVEDQTLVVATYEGEHNHLPPFPQQEATSGVTDGRRSMVMTLGGLTSDSTGPATISLGLTKPKPVRVTTPTTQPINTPEFYKLMAEQVASSLTKDPSFTAALAAAVTGRFLNQN